MPLASCLLSHLRSASRASRWLVALALAAGAGHLVGCATFNNAKSEAEGQAQDAIDGAEATADNAVDGANGTVENAKNQAEGAPDAAIDELDKKVPGASTDLGLSKRSLFERAGGRAKIDAVASDFVDFLAAHPSIKGSPKVAEALGRDSNRHKQMVAEYLCRVSGGPCQYTGRGMKDAHAGLQVTEAQWKTMGSLFIKALRKNKVPKTERVELATLVAANKPLVVGQ